LQFLLPGVLRRIDCQDANRQPNAGSPTRNDRDNLEVIVMPEQETMRRVQKDQAEGKAPTTQAGEFIREEFHHIREGKHGARSPQQAIAIGLSKARRAGVDLPPPKKGKTTEKTRESAARAYEAGKTNPNHKPSRTRSQATLSALKKEGNHAASHAALSRQTKRAAKERTAAERSASAHKAAESRTPDERSASARKAARTRARRQKAAHS
jgi:hypothetical protein